MTDLAQEGIAGAPNNTEAAPEPIDYDALGKGVDPGLISQAVDAAPPSTDPLVLREGAQLVEPPAENPALTAAEAEAIDHELPAAPTSQEGTVQDDEKEREAILQGLAEVKAKLDEVMAKFEAPANKPLSTLPVETAPVGEEVATQAASLITDQASESVSNTTLSGRGGQPLAAQPPTDAVAEVPVHDLRNVIDTTGQEAVPAAPDQPAAVPNIEGNQQDNGTA